MAKKKKAVKKALSKAKPKSGKLKLPDYVTGKFCIEKEGAFLGTDGTFWGIVVEEDVRNVVIYDSKEEAQASLKKFFESESAPTAVVVKVVPLKEHFANHYTVDMNKSLVGVRLMPKTEAFAAQSLKSAIKLARLAYLCGIAETKRDIIITRKENYAAMKCVKQEADAAEKEIYKVEKDTLKRIDIALKEAYRAKVALEKFDKRMSVYV